MYTTQSEYENIFGVWNNSISYSVFEQYAVMFLENYCYAFPSTAEWIDLDESIKVLISNAIYYQIHYMSGYGTYFINGNKDEISSVTIGRFSKSGTPIDYTKLVPYDNMAMRFMDETNICNNQICEKLNKCDHGCGCH